MIFMLDTDVLIFMIRALRSSGRYRKLTAEGQSTEASASEPVETVITRSQ